MKGEFWRIMFMEMDYGEFITFRKSDEGFAMRFKSGLRLEKVMCILKSLGVKDPWLGEIWAVHQSDNEEEDGEVEIYIDVENFENLKKGEKDADKD